RHVVAGAGAARRARAGSRTRAADHPVGGGPRLARRARYLRPALRPLSARSDGHVRVQALEPRDEPSATAEVDCEVVLPAQRRMLDPHRRRVVYRVADQQRLTRPSPRKESGTSTDRAVGPFAITTNHRLPCRRANAATSPISLNGSTR